MSLDTWWSAVRPATRDWIIAHNGEPLPADVVEDITRVSGPVEPEAWWVAGHGPDGLELSDAAVDWIEAVANGEGAQEP